MSGKGNLGVKILDVLTWIEAYSEYERLLSEYHGIQVYSILCKYRSIIIDWSRKYNWYYIQSFDVANRGQMSGRSLNFSDYDMVLFTSTFHPGTLKNATGGSSNSGIYCFGCGKPDHKKLNCPLRFNTGNPSNRGQAKG